MARHLQHQGGGRPRIRRRGVEVCPAASGMKVLNVNSDRWLDVIETTASEDTDSKAGFKCFPFLAMKNPFSIFRVPKRFFFVEVTTRGAIYNLGKTIFF